MYELHTEECDGHTVQAGWIFKIPPVAGGTDFFSHRGSAFYSIEPPTGADFLPTATPPRSLCETAQLPV